MFFGVIGHFADARIDPEQKRLGDGSAGTIVVSEPTCRATTQQPDAVLVLGLLLGIIARHFLTHDSWLIRSISEGILGSSIAYS